MNTSSDNQIVYRTFPVVGMTCAACAVSLESYLGSLTGVSSVVVSYPNQSVYIEFNEGELQEGRLGDAAKEIGYELVTNEADSGTEAAALRAATHLNTLKRKLRIAILCTAPIFLISMVFMNQIPHEGIIQFLLSFPVILFSGRDFYSNAIKKIKHLQTTMDSLVALSTATAFLYSSYQIVLYYLSLFDANPTPNHHATGQSAHQYHPHFYFESATVIITLILLGKFLEERAKTQSAKAIHDLLSLQPTQVTVLRNNIEITIPTAEIILGDFVIIKPGERIPVDGKVRSGSSYIDESAITGEPLPALKEKGSPVFAGTLNQQGTLKILAQKIGKQTLLAQIIVRVEQALGSKPEIQELADRISSIFVPTVFLIAVFSALFWYFFPFNTPPQFALTTFINVLIIACPCALGLATPTALMVGIGKGAKHGILIKDAQALELANKITDIVFDKTGTLTLGKPMVAEMQIFQTAEHSETQILQILKSIESKSEHPLAQAIIEHVAGISKSNPFATAIEPNAFTNLPGKGIIAQINGIEYHLGSWNWITSHPNLIIEETAEKISQQLLNQAETTIALSSENQLLAIIGISDPIKNTAAETLSRLHDLNIQIHMLTGDNAQTAKAVADQLKIQHLLAQALPNTKFDYIKMLQSQQRV
ncbi:MAG: heavy metal translocating P-type ATPase, partial [Bacteroidota bacterium]